jgi:hypothetical protein
MGCVGCCEIWRGDEVEVFGVGSAPASPIHRTRKRDRAVGRWPTMVTSDHGNNRMWSYRRILISTIPQANSDIARIICTAEGHERPLSAGAPRCDDICLSDIMSGRSASAVRRDNQSTISDGQHDDLSLPRVWCLISPVISAREDRERQNFDKMSTEF